MNPRNSIILCVDDEEANLKLLENILVPRGYAVVGAASGKDALLKIKSQAIDLVLLDILMPEMDGFEVCRQIKEDQKLRNIPVIMITVLTAKQDRIRGIEAGAEEFLSRPFDQTEVLARIKILLKMKELNDDRERAEEALRKSHAELDCLVQERTAELAQANAMLQADITERKRAEEALYQRDLELRTALSEIKTLKDQLEAENIIFRQEIKMRHQFDHILGQSDGLKYVLYRAEQVAPMNTTVLILGETGTGKELIAAAIHNMSPRKERPLITVKRANCSAGRRGHLPGPIPGR
jgi:DNA-binding NtrC family response regulator